MATLDSFSLTGFQINNQSISKSINKSITNQGSFFCIECSSVSRRLPIETLMGEVKPVILDKNDFLKSMKDLNQLPFFDVFGL